MRTCFCVLGNTEACTRCPNRDVTFAELRNPTWEYKPAKKIKVVEIYEDGKLVRREIIQEPDITYSGNAGNLKE